MTDEESNKIDELHRFFFTPPLKGHPTRAQQIEDVLTAVRTGKNIARALLWVLGVIAACGVAWAQIKAVLK